ncbi:MAG: DUF4399 domain-containing protein [Nevskia sp.]|nr:DUF4399 domain-containing protein [Nevskia sp.]
MRSLRNLGLPLVLLLAAACSQKSSDQSAAPSQPAAAPAPQPAAAALQRQKAPAGAKASFVGIRQGDTVTSPFKVGFAVEGLRIAPAGTADPDTGHFHLIIDADLPPQDVPLPASDHVKHYGKGQAEDTLSLPPGQHSLQIELADGAHVPFDPPVVSERITVTVK